MIQTSKILKSPSSNSAAQIGSLSKEKFEYVVLFPPGAMGLELEPVIKSSEREVGCRVKDFYFGVEYNGIEPAQLEHLVNVGDIICSIDDISVRSLPFPEIVELLRSRRNNQRIVRFKNMNAMWSNGETMASPHMKKKDRTQAPKFFNENTENGAPLEEISPIKPALASRTMKSPKTFKSPSSSRQPLTPRQKTRTVISEQPGDMQMVRTPLTPSAVKYLAQHNGSSVSAIQRDEDSFQMQDPLLNEVQEVGAVIGKKAAQLAFIASESLSNHAQTALNHAAVVVPRFSQQEMNQVVQKKNELLAELTRSVLLLREEEEKRMNLEREVELLQDLKRDNEELNDALSHKDSILEDYSLRIKSLETELAVLRTECKQDQQALKTNKSTIDSMKNHNSELMQLIQSLQIEKQKVTEENLQLVRSLEQSEAKRAAEEKQMMDAVTSMKEKSNLTLSEKVAEVNALRNHLEAAQDKWEEHHTSITSKLQDLEGQKMQLESELTKVKTQGQQTAASLQNLITQKGNELQAANVTISEAKGKVASMEITQCHLKNELETCNELRSKAEAKLLEFQSEFQKMDKAIQEKSSECSELASRLAVAEEENRMSSLVNSDLKRELQYFSDKQRLMELTITAQSNEIETLQKDLARLEKAKDCMEEKQIKMKTKQQKELLLLQSQVTKLRGDLKLTHEEFQKESSVLETDFLSLSTLSRTCSASFFKVLSEQTSEISSLQDFLIKSKERESKLNQDALDLKSELDSLVQTHLQEKEGLHTCLLTTQERKSSLETTVTALQEGLQSLQEKHQAVKQECRTKDEDLASLRRQLAAFEQLISTLKESAREEMYSQKEQLESTIEIYIGQLKKHEMETASLMSSLRSAQDESADYKKKLTEAELELQQLRSFADELKCTLQKEVDSHLREKDEWENYKVNDSNKWTERINRLNDDLDQWKMRCEELDCSRRSLVNQIESSDEKYTADKIMRENELSHLQNAINDLKEQLQLKLQEVDAMSFELVTVKATLADIQVEKESVELRGSLDRTNLEENISVLESTIEDQKSEIKRLETEYQELIIKAQRADEDSKNKVRKYQEICVSLSSLISVETAAMKKSLTDMHSEVVCLGGIHQNIYNAMDTRNAALNKELQERKTSLKSLAFQTNNQQALLREKEALFSRVMQAENRCVELESQIMSQVGDAMTAAKELQEQREATKEADERAKSLEASLQDRIQEISNLSKNLSDSKAVQQALHIEIAQVNEVVSGLKSEKSDLMQQISRKLEEMEALKASLQTAELKSQLLEDQIRGMKERVVRFQQLDQAVTTYPLPTDDDAVVQELTMVENAIISARNQETELKKDLLESEEIIARLNRQLEEHQMVFQTQQGNIEHLEKKVLSVEGQMEYLQMERQKLLLDVAALRQELERSSEASASVEESNQQLQAMLIVEKQSGAELSSDLAAAKEIMKSAALEMEQQSAMIASLQDKLHEAEHVVCDNQNRIKELEKQITEKNMQIQSLEEVVAELAREKSVIQQECTDIMTTLDSTQLDMQRKCESLLLKSSSLDAALTEQSLKFSENEAKCNKLLSEKTRLESRIEELERSIEEHKLEEQRLLDEKTQLQDSVLELEKAHQLVDDFAQKLSTLSRSQAQEIETMKSSLTSYQESAAAREAEIVSLNLMIDNMKSAQEDRDNSFESMQAENKTLQQMAKDNFKRISSLREVIQTLESAVSLAELREKEHVDAAKGYEQQLTIRETQFQVMQKQFEEIKCKLLDHRAKYEKQLEGVCSENLEQKKTIQQMSQALSMKTEELDALHRHISELLQATVSPAKVEKPDGYDSTPLDALNIVAKKLDSSEESFDSENDKENISSSAKMAQSKGLTSRGTPSPSSSTKSDSPNAVDVWYTSESQWHDQLLTLSLNMHEVLSFVFYLLQQLQQKRGNAVMGEIESWKLWSTVSMLQQKLHEVLVRPPWTNFLDPVQSLTAAHMLFPKTSAGIAVSSSISLCTVLEMPTAQKDLAISNTATSITMCKVVVQILMQLVRKYKSQVSSLQEQLQHAPMARVEEGLEDQTFNISRNEDKDESDYDVLRASITSENISERISRWMKSVESYEQSQHINQSSAAVSNMIAQDVKTSTVTFTSSTASSKMESQDMKRATEGWLCSPTRATIPKSHTPDRMSAHSARKGGIQSLNNSHSLNLSGSSLDSSLRFDQVLRDDSLETSDVWNISTDKSSSNILDDDARELSFSSAAESG